MMKYVVVLAALIFNSLPANADVLLLVHGYLGSARSWDESGVSQVLRQNGWQHQGVLFADASGVRLFPLETGTSKQRFYSAELPSQAPVMLQAQMLSGMLAYIAEHNPGESISIAAHSAGGVVARAALVSGDASRVDKLISIASPHLGTMRAVQALETTDTPWPLCLVQNFFTGGKTRTLRASRGLLVDLLPPQPGSFLFWLNGQQHPQIEYYSIVRGGPAGLGDQLVPAVSQDMKNLPLLASYNKTILVPSDHWLIPQDGQVIADLVAE